MRPVSISVFVMEIILVAVRKIVPVSTRKIQSRKELNIYYNYIIYVYFILKYFYYISIILLGTKKIKQLTVGEKGP